MSTHDTVRAVHRNAPVNARFVDFVCEVIQLVQTITVAGASCSTQFEPCSSHSLPGRMRALLPSGVALLPLGRELLKKCSYFAFAFVGFIHMQRNR